MTTKKKVLCLLILIICFTTIYFTTSPLKVVNGKLVMSLSPYISVDASVSNEDKKIVSPISVEYKNFDYSEIEKLYINNKEITFKESIDEEGSNNNTIIHYKFFDGSSVVTGSNCFEYYTKFSNSLSQLVDIGHPDLLNLHGENQGQLDFLSKNVVIFNVLEQLSNIGIHNSKLSNIYSFNNEELNKRKQELLLNSPSTGEEKSNEEKEWTKEDECYLIVFDQFINDIAIDANEYNKRKEDHKSKEEHNMKNQIVVLYNKDGIQMIKATAMYSQKQEESPQKIMSLKEALRVYKKKYQKESNVEEKYIKGIDLVYVKETNGSKNKDLLLTPAWRFTVYEEDGQGSIVCVYFDAVSEMEL